MIHSDKLIAQQIVSICDSKNINKVVISPGSRNAPLIIEFNAYTDISKYSVVDERSAGFFALGLAKQTQEPVALVCSSGSALLNYYPAIAEAFYSKIPLVIISADRPKHLIDIGDGQTIRQEHVYQNHIGFSANLQEKEIATNYELLNAAFQELFNKKLPIHINAPFDEPIYDTTTEFLVDISKWQIEEQKDSLLDEKPLEVDYLQKYANIWNRSTRKMVVLGEMQPNEMLQTQLTHLTKDSSVIVLVENTSNVHHSKFITNIDQAIFPFDDDLFEIYKPEILLTFGGMVVSKKIKQLLRKNPPKHHWHIDNTRSLDTFHCLSEYFKVSPVLFFSQFFFLTEKMNSDYQQKWLDLKQKRLQNHHQYIQSIPFTDLKVFSLLNKTIPSEINLQFSNSATIRYAQLFDWSKNQIIGCNRGTSGIDGSTSTAVGVAVASTIPTVFITGDLSFFYDSNALWNKYIPANFRIIVINNGGGGIFRFIPGPTTTNTLEYFETPHNLTAKQLCEMHKLEYITVSDENTLQKELTVFFELSDKPKLLEIFTPKELNAAILKAYFNNL